MVYDNNTLPGMSGGVVLDENGKIVGVHGRADADHTKATDDPSIRLKTGFNLAIPINSYLSLTNQIAFNLNANTALTADDYLIQAYQKHQQKDYQGAISSFNQAIALNPNDANDYYNRGLTYYRLEKYPEAIADYSKAIELNPQDDYAYSNRGNAYNDLQKYPEAIADYSKAIELNPQYALAYANMGLAKLQLGENQSGRKDLQTAAELARRQGNIEAYQKIIQILQQALPYL